MASGGLPTGASNYGTPDPAVTQAVGTPPERLPPQQNDRIAYIYLAPIIISVILFTIFPFIYTLYISFTNYSFVNFTEFDFVGLRQYREALDAGSEFFPVLRWTLTFMTVTTILNVGIGIFLALLLNNPNIPERNLYRTLLIIPWALPFILLVQVFTGIFNNQGPINTLLENAGFDPVTWFPFFGDPTAARFALLFVNLWFTYPFFMTVGLAALQAIPTDLYEVANLDGANWWTKFRDITWPFLLSAVTPLLITQAAFQFNNAGIIILFSAGNPLGDPLSNWGLTDTLASFAYDLIYTQRDYGLGAAYSAITFVFIAALLIVSSLVTRSFREEN